MFTNRNRRLRMESLEERNLLAFDSAYGYLGIKGTGGDDVIHVEIIEGIYDYSFDIELTLNDEHARYSFSYWDNHYQGVVILGLGGNDQITIANNVPVPGLIDAGKGDDTIITASGTHLYPYRDYYDDVIIGGAGNDTIFSGIGRDTINGGAGNDTIHCGIDNDIALGGKGNDTIHGDDGDDAIAGDAGIDALYGDDGDDNCAGGAGIDSLFGGDGLDLLQGGAGNDFLHGDNGSDALIGDAGIDALFGDDGDDILDGSAGVDELHGGDGTDGLFGGAGNDTLYGNNEPDHLDGGKGHDTCLGGDGNDQLKGGLGNDYLDGQSGDNLLDNEAQRDVLLNGLVADLDQEFRIGEWSRYSGPFAQLDIQNVNGQVVSKLTVTVQYMSSPSYYVDLIIDGVAVAPVPINPYGSNTVTFSTDPAWGEYPFPLGAALPGPGSTIGFRGNWTNVQAAVATYVI